MKLSHHIQFFVYLGIDEQSVFVAGIIYRKERISVNTFPVLEKIQIEYHAYLREIEKVDARLQFVFHRKSAACFYSEGQEDVFHQSAHHRRQIYFRSAGRAYGKVARNGRPVIERTAHRLVFAPQRLGVFGDVAFGIDTYGLHFEIGFHEIGKSRRVRSVGVVPAYAGVDGQSFGDVEVKTDGIERIVEIHAQLYPVYSDTRPGKEHSEKGIDTVVVEMQREYRIFFGREGQIFESARAVRSQKHVEESHNIQPASLFAVGVTRPGCRGGVGVIRVDVFHIIA